MNRFLEKAGIYFAKKKYNIFVMLKDYKSFSEYY